MFRDFSKIIPKTLAMANFIANGIFIDCSLLIKFRLDFIELNFIMQLVRQD